MKLTPSTDEMALICDRVSLTVARTSILPVVPAAVPRARTSAPAPMAAVPMLVSSAQPKEPATPSDDEPELHCMAGLLLPKKLPTALMPMLRAPTTMAAKMPLPAAEFAPRRLRIVFEWASMAMLPATLTVPFTSASVVLCEVE